MPKVRLQIFFFLFLCLTNSIIFAQPGKNPPPGVLVAAVSEKSLTKTAEILGKTIAVNDVSIRARVSGYLLEKNFRDGSDLQQGSVLFRIDPSIYAAVVSADKAAVAEAQAQVARTVADFNRYTELSKKDYVSQQDFDLSKANKLQAAAKLKSANAQLKRSEIDLGDTEIKAPISGRIGRSKISVGNLIDNSSGELVRLVELDPIYVNFNISETQLLELQSRNAARKAAGEHGSQYRFDLVLPNGKLYAQTGLVDFIDNAVSLQTGTVLIRAKFPNPDKSLIPGLNVQVQISSTEKKNELTLPQVAVQEDQTGYFALLVNSQDLVEKRALKLGRKVGVDWVIEEGLIAGDRVIISGVQKVRPGIKVKAEWAPENPEANSQPSLESQE